MMRLLALILAIALPLGATANEGRLAVAAGEHSGFSRIVFPSHVERVDFDRERGIVEARLAPGVSAVDLDEINVRAKAHRVRRAEFLREGDRRLVRLHLGCDCALSSRQGDNGRYVLDFSGAPRTTSAAASSAPAPQLAAQPTQIVRAPAQEPAESMGSLSVEEAQARMLEVLQRAADDGVLTVRRGATHLEKPPSPAGAAEGALAVAPPVRASTIQGAAIQETAQICRGEAFFALNAAEFDSDPLRAISDFQKKLADAEPAHKAAIALVFAQGYLTIGFGEEALALLQDYDAAGGAAYAEMAQVVAGRTPRRNGVVMGANDCEGAHALWRAAAETAQNAVEPARRSGDAINALPRRLRAQIASRIAVSMVEAEAWEEAARFLAVAKEATDSHDESLDYVAARLLEQQGRADEAETMLEEIAASNAGVADQALLALARRQAETHTAPASGLADDLSMLSMRARGTAQGGEAAWREAMIWADAGEIEAAVLLLRRAGEHESVITAATDSARAIIMKGFASGDAKTETAALRSYLEHKAFIDGRGVDPVLENAAAQLSLRMGLPDLALRLSTREATARDAALLRTQAALAASRPDVAVAAAAPFAGEPAFAELLYEAQLAAGQHHNAIAATAGLPDKAEQAEKTAAAAWLAGDWRTAANAYRTMNPARMNETQALRFALSARMVGETTLPASAEAVLGEKNPSLLRSAKALFATNTGGPIIDRASALVRDAEDEIELIERMLRDG